MPGKKKIIGIIGTIGSGKDTVAEYISIKLKIPSFQISQPLRDIAKDNNIEPTRENLINIGSALIKENGPNFFAELVLDKIDSNIGIITGIRVLGVIDYLRENSNFVLLALQSDPQIRFERSIIRSK